MLFCCCLGGIVAVSLGIQKKLRLSTGHKQTFACGRFCKNWHYYVTALCPLCPEYCTPYRQWLRQILGMSNPD